MTVDAEFEALRKDAERWRWLRAWGYRVNSYAPSLGEGGYWVSVGNERTDVYDNHEDAWDEAMRRFPAPNAEQDRPPKQRISREHMPNSHGEP